MTDGKARLYMAQRKMTIRDEIETLSRALSRLDMEMQQIEEAEAALEQK